jgi:hypothetical protein
LETVCKTLKPAAAAANPAIAESERRVATDTGIKEGGGIAEAFANVVAPGGRADRGSNGLLDLGRFAEFAKSAMRKLMLKEAGVFGASRVAQPSPDEMEDFVDKNEPQQSGSAKQLRFKDDATIADETRGVNGGAFLRTSGQEASAMSGELR